MDFDFQNKKIIILGLGIEGLALLQYFADQNVAITVYDRQSLDEIKSSFLDHPATSILDRDQITKMFSGTEIPDLGGYDVVFRSPSVYFDHNKIREAKEKGVLISTQIDLFMRLCPCKVIGVTGTKGKGTTASLIFSILKKNYEFRNPNDKISVYLAGNIGYPAITLLPQIKQEDVVILELSNFQLADISKAPDIAVVTNISVDHLDYHKTIEEYRDAKFNILKLQKQDDIAIVNLDSNFGDERMAQVSSKILYFSKNDTNYDACIREGTDGLFEAVLGPKDRNLVIASEGEARIVGKHNLENICAAALACDQLGVPFAVITESVKIFNGLPHRLEVVGEINNITFINDSFATNPGPTMAAIDSFRENKVLILGGSSKGADFSEMAKLIASTNVKAVVLIGAEGDRIKKALLDSNYSGEISHIMYDLKEAVLAAKEQSQGGDLVIFSPACASFDMFKNYKDRGEQFKTIVSEIANE